MGSGSFSHQWSSFLLEQERYRLQRQDESWICLGPIYQKKRWLFNFQHTWTADSMTSRRIFLIPPDLIMAQKNDLFSVTASGPADYHPRRSPVRETFGALEPCPALSEISPRIYSGTEICGYITNWIEDREDVCCDLEVMTDRWRV